MKELIELLKQHKMTISFAESCTGGLISKTLTDFSGVSEVFGYGVTTYSNEAKMKILGVSEETLKSFGAVSEETAFEMVKGVQRLSGSDVAVSVTGIAGPSSDGTSKKVGTVCFGIAFRDKIFTKVCHFDGNRQEVRAKTCSKAVELLTLCFAKQMNDE